MIGSRFEMLQYRSVGTMVVASIRTSCAHAAIEIVWKHKGEKKLKNHQLVQGGPPSCVCWVYNKYNLIIPSY
jgi:exosome complex RNA-binding protein Rrp4